jgi:hypothetical protein
MIDETPIIYLRAKNCVYTTIIENKLTTLLANECSFHQYIMCVYSCTWKEEYERIFSDCPSYKVIFIGSLTNSTGTIKK